MKKYIVIMVLMLFTFPVHAALDGPQPLNNIVHSWRVIHGNTGPIPMTGFLFTGDGKGNFTMVKWDVDIMGYDQPSDEEFNSYSAVSAASRVVHDKMKSADFTKWSKRERVMMKLFRQEINILRALRSLPTYSVDEWRTKLETMM